ncbi:hypothetical protein PF008_g9307 [Phytophthora fragariae]|uniref:Uncharacterized protein n=1 Tax=Phytophthora fragariae TaxID=53985 RepID=A0A6G0RXN6_9STRA|nr:hypothetical protein PF008_g9307 [Phytophthora fragariae]
MDAQHTHRSPHAPRSPLKIQPEEFVDTPSSSATTSPAESCASDVVKQPKPWERTASMSSSSGASESLWEDDEEEQEEEPEGSIVVEHSANVRTVSLRMQTLVRGMHQRMGVLQRLMREAELQEKLQQRLKRPCAPAAETSSSCFFSFAETSDGEPACDLQKRAASTANNERSVLVLAPPAGWVKETTTGNEVGESAADDQVDTVADQQQNNRVNSSTEGVPPAVTTLLNQVKNLQAQLKEVVDENQQLKYTVHRLEEENARLQAQTAFNLSKSGSGPPGSDRGRESNCGEGTEAGDRHDGDISCLSNAIFGDSTAFQMAMEEDLAVLKNHERCQHKLHELWDTVRTLKTFVETYEIERNVMRAQRDEAITDADRADAENVKLASSSNPQQKIKYLQQVKKDNQELRRKNRALNMRIARQAAKVICEKNGCSVLGDGEASIDTLESTMLGDTIEDSNGHSAARSGEEVLRSMRDRSGVLEQRLERLRLARQQVDGCREETSGSESEIPAHSAEVPLVATSPRSVTDTDSVTFLSMSSNRRQDLRVK